MNPTIRIAIIGILWVIFVLYWLIPAARFQRTVRTNAWRYFGLIGLMWIVCIILIAVIFQVSGVRDLFASYGVSNPAVSCSVLGYIGVPLCAAGMILTIWARAHLGRNWGPPMSLTENPEVITSGPYRFVRHPIYSGGLLAILGTALFLGGLWFFVVLFFVFCFVVFSAKREERILTKQLPDEYPEYMKRTKMLIPYV